MTKQLHWLLSLVEGRIECLVYSLFIFYSEINLWFLLLKFRSHTLIQFLNTHLLMLPSTWTSLGLLGWLECTERKSLRTIELPWGLFNFCIWLLLWVRKLKVVRLLWWLLRYNRTPWSVRLLWLQFLEVWILKQWTRLSFLWDFLEFCVSLVE